VGRSDGDIVLRGTLTLLPGETTPASAAH